ncbi:hypothetical protein GF407_14050 [candidate division KSB1 bacterium]|nr:hypothetical protein [candidate division KSB1 bacterium]
MKAHQIISLAISLMLFAGHLVSPGSLYSKPPEAEQQKQSGYVILPILSYMPETKLAGGLVMNYYFRDSKSHHSKPSNLLPTFMVTQKQQISIEMPTEIYWQDDMYYFNGYIGYAKFPDKFYGIGNDTKEEGEENYTPRMFQVRSNVQRKITADTYVGIQYNLKYTYGLGLRFQLNPKENINVRLDFGFGKESSGLYLAIGEAF